MAPEVFQSQKFGEASDVWSFGVTCCEVFTKAATPYYDWSNVYVCERVQGGYQLERPADCPDWIYDNAITPCFDLDPKERPSFEVLASSLAAYNYTVRRDASLHPIGAHTGEAVPEAQPVHDDHPRNFEPFVPTSTPCEPLVFTSTADAEEIDDDSTAAAAPSPPPWTLGDPAGRQPAGLFHQGVRVPAASADSRPLILPVYRSVDPQQTRTPGPRSASAATSKKPKKTTVSASALYDVRAQAPSSTATDTATAIAIADADSSGDDTIMYVPATTLNPVAPATRSSQPVYGAGATTFYTAHSPAGAATTRSDEDPLYSALTDVRRPASRAPPLALYAQPSTTPQHQQLQRQQGVALTSSKDAGNALYTVPSSRQSKAISPALSPPGALPATLPAATGNDAQKGEMDRYIALEHQALHRSEVLLYAVPPDARDTASTVAIELPRLTIPLAPVLIGSPATRRTRRPQQSSV